MSYVVSCMEGMTLIRSKQYEQFDVSQKVFAYDASHLACAFFLCLLVRAINVLFMMILFIFSVQRDLKI